MRQLKSLPSSNLYESNKTFIKMLSDGFILKRENRSEKVIYVQLIDYQGLEKQRSPHADKSITIVAQDKADYIDNNIYKFVTQLEISGSESNDYLYGTSETKLRKIIYRILATFQSRIPCLIMNFKSPLVI
ncbi:MAG TPA: type I restriction endonuclease [Ignavibacteria bacterium]|nr:type I restriction endonuclease [Ignavibacteria bacterium]